MKADNILKLGISEPYLLEILPVVLVPVAERFGVATAVKIACACYGCVIELGDVGERPQNLIEVLGEDMTEQVCSLLRESGRQYVQVTKGDFSTKKYPYLDGAAAFERGLTLGEIKRILRVDITSRVKASPHLSALWKARKLTGGKWA